MTAKISSSQKLLILLSMKPLSPAIHPCIFHEKAKIFKRFGRRLMWSKSEEGFPVHWHCVKFSRIYRILVLMPWFGDVVLLPFRLLRLVLEGVFAFFGKSRTPKHHILNIALQDLYFGWPSLNSFCQGRLLVDTGVRRSLQDPGHGSPRVQARIPWNLQSLSLKNYPHTLSRGVCSLQILDSNDMIHLRICSTLSLHGFPNAGGRITFVNLINASSQGCI